MKNFNDKEFATKLKEIQNRTLFQNEITEKKFYSFFGLVFLFLIFFLL